MADTFYYYIVCPTCNGDGVVTTTSPIPPYPAEDISCPKCLGEHVKHPKAGYLFNGIMEQYDAD